MSSSTESSSPDPDVAAGDVLQPRRMWPLLAVRGGFAVVFGVLALAWPQVTVLALAIVFGVYAIIDGIGALGHAFRRDADIMRRLSYALLGVLGIAAGVVTLLWPVVTVAVLAALIGIWAIVTGVVEIVAAVRYRHLIRGEALLIVAGALSVIAGLVLLVWPLAGALGIAVVIGAYAVVYGVMLIVLALRVHRLRPS